MLPIDPFSTCYWTPTNESSKNGEDAGGKIMKPPHRMPLNTLKGPNQIYPQQPITENTAKASKLANAKPLPPELMSDFKKVIDGSKLSKIGLIEVLKKE
jgi:chromatin assembly factor 1 subunit A